LNLSLSSYVLDRAEATMLLIGVLDVRFCKYCQRRKETNEEKQKKQKGKEKKQEVRRNLTSSESTLPARARAYSTAKQGKTPAHGQEQTRKHTRIDKMMETADLNESTQQDDKEDKVSTYTQNFILARNSKDLSTMKLKQSHGKEDVEVTCRMLRPNRLRAQKAG
jgi:hypothetical protein